jgi:GntR family transcriptional repressor for pyruvate dehydrogenase complex
MDDSSEATRRQVNTLEITPSRSSDEAQRYLRSLIFMRHLQPGDRLPAERQLSARLGIAPLTLRVALRALESEGFITIKRGAKGGPRISDAVALNECWLRWMTTREDEVRDLLEFRGIVQEKIAAFAAERHTSGDLQLLEEAKRPPAEPSASIVVWHLEFHDALARAAHNRSLEEAVRSSEQALFIPVMDPESDPFAQENRDFHEDMFAAVRDSDAIRATAVMNAHTHYVDDVIWSYFRRSENAAS